MLMTIAPRKSPAPGWPRRKACSHSANTTIIANPSVINRAGTLTRPNKAKTKSAATETKRSARRNRPRPSPKTVAAVPAKIKEMDTAIIRRMADQLMSAAVWLSIRKP